MTLPLLTLPFPPNVPNLPGVPALAGYISSVLPPALTGDSLSVTSQAASAALWGIYLDGSPALIPDSIRSVSPSKEWAQLDYPTEDGAFQSYNKVERPLDVHVEMLQGGTDSDRGDFLATLWEIAGDLNLYDVVTPEYTYFNVNFERPDYERTASTLLTVRILLKEIRVTATVAFSKTVAPVSASAVNDGTVQAQPPTPGQTTATAGGAQ